MPSFAYPTMATAVVRQGATPVFVDVDPGTLNLDPGRGGESGRPPDQGDRRGALRRRRLRDGRAARDRRAGRPDRDRGCGALPARQLPGPPARHARRPRRRFSFHHTKNVSSGEGGALLVNNPALLERAEVIWDKGTDRARFQRGEVDRYTWVDVGSSFAASELTAAFLWAQLEARGGDHPAPAGDLGALPRGVRRARGRGAGAAAGGARRTRSQRPPLLPDPAHRAARETPSSRRCARTGIATSFHYVPLHSSPAGRRFGRSVGDLAQTEQLSQRLVRLPLWTGLEDESVERVIDAARAALNDVASSRA